MRPFIAVAIAAASACCRRRRARFTCTPRRTTRKDGIISTVLLSITATTLIPFERNGIMLVSHIRHLREKEGVSRLPRGGWEPGSEIRAPMAMVIMFGLLSSTALIMIVVPVLYERFGDRGPVSQVASFL